MPVCWFFQNGPQGCHFGSDCWNLHIREVDGQIKTYRTRDPKSYTHSWTNAAAGATRVSSESLSPEDPAITHSVAALKAQLAELRDKIYVEAWKGSRGTGIAEGGADASTTEDRWRGLSRADSAEGDAEADGGRESDDNEEEEYNEDEEMRDDDDVEGVEEDVPSEEPESEEMDDEDFWTGPINSVYEYDYQPPLSTPPPSYTFPRLWSQRPHNSVVFKSTVDWDPAEFDREGIDFLEFGADFAITDTHIYELATNHEDFLNRLEVFKAGSSESGHGGQVTDESLIELIPLMSNLRDLTLSSFYSVTADALPFIAQLPRLEHLEISGNDRIRGQIKGKDLHLLSASVSLRFLHLWDQTISTEYGKEASSVNDGVVVKWGDTAGDGMASQFVADMSGGDVSFTYYRGRACFSD